MSIKTDFNKTDSDYAYFEVTKDMFDEPHLLTIGVAIHSDSNFNHFMDCEDNAHFLKSNTNNVMMKCMDLFIEKRGAMFVLYINDNLAKIIALLKDSSITAEDIYQSEEHDHNIRIILKCIALKIGHEQLCNTKLSEAIEKMYEYMRSSFDFLDYALALYIRWHFDTLGVSLKRQMRFEQILNPYIDLCEAKFRKGKIEKELHDKNKEISSLQRDNQRKDKIIAQKKKHVGSLNSQIDDEKRIHKTLQANNQSKIKTLMKTIDGKETIISNFSNKNDALKNTKLKGENTQLQNEVKNLKKSYAKLKNESNRLQNKMDTIDEIPIQERLRNYLETYGINDQLNQLIHLYFKDFMSEDTPKKIQIIDSTYYKEVIGICEIKDGVHYFRDINDHLYEIHNIPEKTYLAQHGFVKVGTNLNFVCGYTYHYVEKSMPDYISKFVLLTIEGDELFAISEENIKIRLKNPSGYSLFNNEIVAINQNNEIMTFYKRIPFQLDYYKKSIQAKKHSAYLVLKTIENGLILRDVFDNTELFLKINNYQRKPYEIILIKDDTIIKVIDNPRSYTTSSSYNGSKIGKVQVIDDRVYAAKLNHEMVLLQRVPNAITLTDGQLVRFDEFNGYIRMEKDTIHLEKSDDEKILLARRKENNDTHDAQKGSIVLDKGKVLVVGDIKLQSAYSKKLNAEGYEVDVINGFESHHKICTLARSSDLVIFVTEHASHDNYFMVKDAFNDKVVYSDNGGSNRILETVQANMESIGSYQIV